MERFENKPEEAMASIKKVLKDQDVISMMRQLSLDAPEADVPILLGLCFTWLHQNAVLPHDAICDAARRLCPPPLSDTVPCPSCYGKGMRENAPVGDVFLAKALVCFYCRGRRLLKKSDNRCVCLAVDGSPDSDCPLCAGCGFQLIRK